MTARLEALRTPEDRFAQLPGYAFRPHYLDDLKGYEGLRVHAVDERPTIGARSVIGDIKISFHQSGLCRIALNEVRAKTR